MKKAVLVLVVWILTTTGAFASKSRMEALGQSSGTGSYYISDSRNIFANPAEINIHKNFIITEWGQANDDEDSSVKPHAEGGFFKEDGSFVYGIYLGSELGAQNAERAENGVDQITGDPNFLMHDNGVDFFFGGDAGMLWGIRAHAARASDDSSGFERSHDSYEVGVGAILNQLLYNVNLTIKDVSEGATTASDKWEKQLGGNASLKYLTGNFTLFLNYTKTAYKYTGVGANADETYSEYLGGVAWLHDINQTSKIFIDLYYAKSHEEISGTNPANNKIDRLPITIAFEAMATTWLDIRGSISQNFLYGETGATTTPNTTTVAAGATLKLNKVKLEGLLGANENSTNKGKLDSVTRVSLQYSF